MTQTHHPLQGILLALAAFLVYSSHDVVVKLLGGSLSPVQIIFFSVLFGFPMVTLFLLRDQTVANLIPKYPGWACARTLATVVAGLGTFYAFSNLPMAQVYAILFASPMFVTVLAIPLLGEKVGIHRGLAVVLGLAGVLVVVRPGVTELQLGHAAAFCAAMAGAFASVVVRKVGGDERPVVLILYPMAANFILMGCALPFVYNPMVIGELGGMAAIALLALIGTTLLIQAYRRTSAALVAPMQYSQIVWASLYGFLFFEEALGLSTVVGAGMIVLSGGYIVLRESGKGKASATPVLRTRTRIGMPGAPRLSPFLKSKLFGRVRKKARKKTRKKAEIKPEEENEQDGVAKKTPVKVEDAQSFSSIR